ncbi:MAG TPA: DUF305 domain-containing protein [Anaerolineales bacterium]|nr:DUF305 domain-containing protein [Anaerolineales bacterium]
MITRKHVGFLLTRFLVLSLVLPVSSPVQADAPAPDAGQAEFEIGFMQDMIDHHASAVMMAKFCLQRAVHEELIALCQQMLEDQEQEIELTSEWLMDWYDIDYKARISPEERQMMSHLLRHRAEEFEMHFMHMMIMHHSMAVEMSQTCLEMAYHPELVSLCETIIATQTAEIEQMQMWLCEWYEHCDGGHHHHMMS